MKIKPLSPHGFGIEQVFDQEQLDVLCHMVDTFTPMVVRHSHDAHREEYEVPRGPEYEKIKSYLFGDLCKIKNSFANLGAISLWRDYPKYENGNHYDDPALSHIVIVYLGNGNNGHNGTRWFEDEKEYSVRYEINSGLILLNSNHTLHGMIGTVENMDYRRSLYINWK
jgi:hypothetical protein